MIKTGSSDHELLLRVFLAGFVYGQETAAKKFAARIPYYSAAATKRNLATILARVALDFHAEAHGKVADDLKDVVWRLEREQQWSAPRRPPQKRRTVRRRRRRHR